HVEYVKTKDTPKKNTHIPVPIFEAVAQAEKIFWEAIAYISPVFNGLFGRENDIIILIVYQPPSLVINPGVLVHIETADSFPFFQALNRSGAAGGRQGSHFHEALSLELTVGERNEFVIVRGRSKVYRVIKTGFPD